MKIHSKLMFSDMQDGIELEADYERDVLVLELPSGRTDFSLSHLCHILVRPYRIEKPGNDWKSAGDMSVEEKSKLRPIAETLAMLDGNAFFGMDTGHGEIWEQYLGEAHALYQANGGDSGWAGEASFAKKVA